MKDLNVYIEELLYKHQCVIIPKFGAFISNRKSAQMAEDKTFDPPKRELSFNASLTSNDGLLIKYISEQTGIEYNLVEDYVNLAVEGWKRILKQDQTLNLEKIGTLRLVGEGRISFEPADDVNFLTDSFGMAPFVPHVSSLPTTTFPTGSPSVRGSTCSRPGTALRSRSCFTTPPRDPSVCATSGSWPVRFPSGTCCWLRTGRPNSV